MPNSFSKEERVAFEDVLEGFNDALVLSKNVSLFRTDQTLMSRSNDIMWRPMPYVARSFDGMDQTANFRDMTQLSVPATIGFKKSSPWVMDASELRDALQEGRLGDAAKQKLASDINVAVLNVASSQGTLVVRRPGAATGFDDVAICDAAMTEIGVQDFDRSLALSSRDYTTMAGNLAARQTLQTKTLTAYEKAYIGMIASFETFKLDYANRLLAASGGGGITINTLDAGPNHYTPLATRAAGTGEVSNVDNRYQVVTVSSTANVRAGDAFTVAGLNSVHLITKNDTGQLKTFRVIAVNSGTAMTISPPIITNQVANDAAAQYQNCVINVRAVNSAIVWLNTASAAVNPFWQKDAIEILPGRYAIPTGAGADVIRASTDQGIELVMQKQYDIATMRTRYRMDVAFGVVNKQPEMSGILIFGQP